MAGRVFDPSPLPGYDRLKLLSCDELRELWAVRERESGKLYTLVIQRTKLLNHAMLSPADESERIDPFGKELLILMRLNHPNILHAREAGRGEGCAYYLEELEPGDSADERQQARGGRLPFTEATWVILQTLSGLSYLHGAAFDIEVKRNVFSTPQTLHVRGLVHRDIKPDNLLLTDASDRPAVKIVGLDTARLIGVEEPISDRELGSVMIGSPAFMPRQQMLNMRTAGPEVDVWAAAASYYYLITGEAPKPFGPGKNTWQVIMREPAVPIRERNDAVPKPLAAVIDRALRDNPEIGYQTAAAFREDIIAALPEEAKRAFAPLIG